MPRTISVPQNGAATRLRVDTAFGIFREHTASARIINVDGLQTVVKLSGSGNVGDVAVTVADPDGAIKTRLDSYNIHMTDARIYQEIEDEFGSVTTVLLFKGQVNSPINWSPDSGTIGFSIVTDIESEDIGFALEQNDFPIGQPIDGLTYPNGRAVTEVPATLEGKTWPLVFGSCIHVPAVGFTLEDELTSDDNDEQDKEPQATVAGGEWFPIEPSFVQEFFDVCFNAMDAAPGEKWPIAIFIKGDLAGREEGYNLVSPSAVEGKAKSWSTYTQLLKRIREVHPDKIDDFEAFRDFIFKDVKKLNDDWNEEGTKDDLHAEFSSIQHLIFAKLGPQIKAFFIRILQLEWPKIPLNPDHGLKRGQNPDDPDRLLGDEVEPTFYNINNAKIAGWIDGKDVLNVTDIVATYENIAIRSSGNDPTMFKVRVQNSDELNNCDEVKIRAVDLNGMYLFIKVKFVGHPDVYKQLVKVNKHVKIPKKDGNGAIIKDDNGNIEYEAESEVFYTPVCLMLDSDFEFPRANIEFLIYRLESLIIESGSIVEAAPFCLPKWGLSPQFDTDARVNPLMNPDTWVLNTKITTLGPNALNIFPDTILLKSKVKLGTTGWSINNGDEVFEWGKYRQGENSCGDRDATDFGQAWTWICNNMHNTVVKAVYAYRTFRGRKIFAEVPSSYFTVDDNRTIANEPCTVIEFYRRLSQYEGEGWEDQIYVTMTSPEGPNTSLICQYLINRYSDYGIDSTSFDETETFLANYPSNFAILQKKPLLSTLEDIAFQCRCVIYVSDTTLFMKYLAKLGASVKTMDGSNIIEGTVTVEYTTTEDLVTKLTGLWKPNYQDLDELYELRPLRRVTLENNVDLYKIHEAEREFWIYNIRSLVEKSVKFWLIRWSNTWKRVRFSTTLDGLEVETQDTVTLNLVGVVADAPLDVISESITYDSTELRLDFDLWTPVRAGEMTPFDLAFLA